MTTPKREVVATVEQDGAIVAEKIVLEDGREMWEEVTEDE